MSNKNLSDLFAAARAELAREQTPNAVTMRDAERLVSSMRTVPHVTIRERLTQSLFSTPLRLATTAMTTAAIITIGTLAVKSLLSSSTPQVQIAQHEQPRNLVFATDTARTKQNPVQPKPVGTSPS